MYICYTHIGINYFVYILVEMIKTSMSFKLISEVVCITSELKKKKKQLQHLLFSPGMAKIIFTLNHVNCVYSLQDTNRMKFTPCHSCTDYSAMSLITTHDYIHSTNISI